MSGQREQGLANYMPATPDALSSTQLPIEDAQALNSLSTQGDMTSADQAIKDATPKNGLTTAQIVRRVLTVAAPTGLGLLLAACHESSVSTGPSCPLPTRPSTTPTTTGETGQIGATSQTKFESAKSNTSATPTATSTPEATPAPTSTICVGTEGTATPNVEKPRWQTDGDYAAFLFLNQDHQSKLTDQEKADWKAMQEYNIYAGSNNQKPMFQSGQYQELPLEGMILSNNTHLSEDKKQIQGYITFGFIVEVNGTRVPQVVKFRLDSTDPWNNKVTNIQGVHKNSDWTNGPGYNSDVADGTIQGEFDWLQANVDHQVALGLTRIYDAKTGRDGGWTLPASIESYKMMKWIQNEGPKPAGILGPDATMDQIAAAPSVSFFCEDAGSL